jgi:predicted glycoside hydrolase/deacetylase ChbG (UPF0249 family)
MIICADDYGLSDDINEAILELCRERRLTAVSCMVALKRCGPATMAELLEVRSKVSTLQIGLHLTFTYEPVEMEPLPVGLYRPRLPSFGQLFRRAIRRRLNLGEVSMDISTQYELFVKKTGATPEFIDGHLHTHQLPGIRERLISFVSNLPAENRPYLRNTAMPLSELRKRGLPWLKAGGIGHFGKRMAALLKRAGLTTNEGFAGIYDFARGERYAEYLPRFADALGDRNGILVVHPGKLEQWRRREFETLRAFHPPRLTHA